MHFADAGAGPLEHQSDGLLSSFVQSRLSAGAPGAGTHSFAHHDGRIVRWQILLRAKVDAHRGRGGSILAGLLGSALYVLALALLLMPLTIVRGAGAEAGVDWARFLALIPLLAGTLAAYIGGVYWEAMNEVVKLGGTPCVGAIDQEYFAQVSQVIPLLLVALGVEARFFDRLRSHSLQRAVTYVTVGILCLAEALAISALPLPNQECGRVLSDWHEYMAFVGTLEACGAALSMLIWALVTTTPANIGRPGSGAAD